MDRRNHHRTFNVERIARAGRTVGTNGIACTNRTVRTNPPVFNPVSRLLIPILLLLTLPGCDGGCGRRDPGPGGLSVQLVVPTGPVEDVSSIDVIFDQPMVAVGVTTAGGASSGHPTAGGASPGAGASSGATTIKSTSSSPTIPPFQIRPRVPGRFRWIGTRTASFVPDEPLAPATRYEGLVTAGTRSVNGKSLPVDHAWSFETPRPAVVRVLPEEGSPDVGPDLRLLVEFNQPVAPASVRRSARLVSATGSTIDLDARRPGDDEKVMSRQWEEGEIDQRVVLVPRRPLALDTEWRLEIQSGLVGLGGSLPMIESWQRTFRTYGPFVVDSLATSPWQSNALLLALSNEVDTDSLLTHVVTDPPVRLRGAWQEWNSGRVTLQGDFRAGVTYRLILRAGLSDVYGQPLQPITLGPVTMPDAPPDLAVIPGDAVIQRTDRREFALILTNVQEARLSMVRVEGAALGRVIRGQPGDDPIVRTVAGNRAPVISDTGSTTTTGAGQVLRTIRRRTPWNAPDTLFLSTDEVLGAGKGGTLLVRVESIDPPKPIPGATLPDGTPRMAPAPRARTLLRVTDLGLTGKTSRANHLFWLTSLATARPIAGAAVAVRTAQGKLVWSGTTNSDGLATGPGLPNVTGNDWPLHAVATTADDQVFLTLGGDWNLEPWNFGLPGGSWNADADMDGMIYGDRDLYRPGETVHLKTILRRRSLDGLLPPGLRMVRITIDDPRGNPIVDRDATVSRFGTISLDWPLDASATPGTWSVRVGPPAANSWQVYGSFTVAEYRAPEFKVDLSAEAPWVLHGQALPIDITASYFFGAPLAGATARWSLSQRPFEFRPPGFDDYSFTDHELVPEYEWLVGRGEVPLDDKGHALLSPVTDLGRTPVSLTWTMEVEVRDETGRASATTIERPIHRGLAYPGISIKERLVTAGDEVSASIVLLDPDGRPARNATAQVRLVRRDWRTVRRLLVGGIIGSETAKVDTVLERKALPTGTGPQQMTFRVPTAGYYRIVVEATDGTKNRQQGAAEFYAAGSGDYAWGWEPGVRLELVADRDRYQPGDTAHVLVRAPVANATALITVEREGIQRHWIRRLNGTSEVVDVPIPTTGAAPNLYLSVAMILGSDVRRGADPRLVKPEFRLGLIQLPVDHRDQELRVDLRPSRVEAGPGDSITVELSLRDRQGRGVSGEVSVAVVDEAVLRLLDTKTPDPLAWFYRPRPLSVTTSELRRQVVKTLGALKAKGGDPGGGGGDGMSFRSAFATTALWKADVVTDTGGRGRFGVRLPDNLTTFRVMVVAVDDGQRFGSADTSLVVTKPLLVQAALPRFATTGDRFTGGAIVHNRTGRPVTVELRATSAGVEMVGPSRPASQSIPANGNRRFDVELVAGAPGHAMVRFQATGGGLADGLQQTFPVIDPVIERYDAATGLVLARAGESIALPASARPESASVNVLLAPSLLGGVDPAFRYLEDYPYGCLEQRASRAWARILEARLGGGNPAVAARQMILDLAPFQSGDGGFVLYPGSSRSQVGLTAWALLALAEAHRVGVATEDLATPARRYLAWQLQSESSDSAAFVTHAADWSMALWALSRWPLDVDAESIFRQTRDFLTLRPERLSQDSRLALALSWSTADGRETATAGRLLGDLLNRVEQVADLAWLREDRSGACTACWEWWWGSTTRSNALYLSALLAQPRRSPLEPKLARRLLEEGKGGRWSNTQENLLGLAALLDYRDRYEGDRPDLVARMVLGSTAVEPVRFTARDAPPIARRWPAPPRGGALPLVIDRSGPGTLYYTAAVHYRETSVGRPAEESALTLTRAWESLDGSRRLASGDLVVVRLTLVVPEAVDFLVLADPLPAGLEPVQLDFRTSGRDAARRLDARKVSDPWGAGLQASHTEMRDREVRAYFDHVRPGVQEFRYLARAVTPGLFGAPRARAELMYHPEVSAFTDGPTLRIEP